MRVLGVIPARGGSTRIPRKNLQMVGGCSLVMRAVYTCYNRDSKLDGKWVVSTDDVDIALECAEAFYEHVHKRRCASDGPMVEVLLDMLDDVPTKPYDAVACIQPTSPFREGFDIGHCIDLLAASPDAGSIVSVNETTGERNGAVYIARVSMLDRGLVFDANSLKYPMHADRSIDINTPEDLELARKLWARLHG